MQLFYRALLGTLHVGMAMLILNILFGPIDTEVWVEIQMKVPLPIMSDNMSINEDTMFSMNVPGGMSLKSDQHKQLESIYLTLFYSYAAWAVAYAILVLALAGAAGSHIGLLLPVIVRRLALIGSFAVMGYLLFAAYQRYQEYDGSWISLFVKRQDALWLVSLAFALLMTNLPKAARWLDILAATLLVVGSIATVVGLTIGSRHDIFPSQRAELPYLFFAFFIGTAYLLPLLLLSKRAVRE